MSSASREDPFVTARAAPGLGDQDALAADPVADAPDEALPQGGGRLRALGWSAAESGARQFITLGLSFGLLAFMTPHDLGVFSLSYALNQIPSVLLDEPILEALVQRAAPRDRDWNTGFTVNLILAALACALSFAVSPVLGRLLHEPALGWTVPAVTLCSLVNAFGAVQKGHLARTLRFRAVAQSMLAAQVLAGVCGLALAIAGFGYWALVGNLAIASIVTAISWWCLCPWRPRFALDRTCLGWLGAYAVRSVALRVVILLRDNAPTVVVGAVFGSLALGYFALAFRIARTLGLFFEDMTRMPLMAVLSREQGDRGAASELLLDVCTVLIVAALPGFVGAALLGAHVPVAVFGPAWTRSGALLPPLCAIVAGWFTLHVPSIALRAAGTGERALWLTAPPIALDFLLLVALAPFGLPVALGAMALRALLALPLLAFAAGRWLGLPAARLGLNLLLPIAATIVMAGVVLLLERWLGTRWLGLAGAAVGGGLAYVALLATAALTVQRSLLQAAARLR